MENNLLKFSIEEGCPVRNVMDRIGDKWSMLVLLVLDDVEKLRFNELHKAIGSISQKMLTVTLKNLEADGLVARTIFAEVPLRVEYKLTTRAISLMPHLHGLVKWSENNIADIQESRLHYAS
jgi:DNA-binding HxlR family transcriptional regulator